MGDVLLDASTALAPALCDILVVKTEFFIYVYDLKIVYVWNQMQNWMQVKTAGT
jgi:hypothetical protein